MLTALRQIPLQQILTRGFTFFFFFFFFLGGHNWPYHDQWEQRVMGSFLEPQEEIRVSKDEFWTMSWRLRKYRSVVWNLSSESTHCSDQLRPPTAYKWTPALSSSSSWLLSFIFLLIKLVVPVSGLIWLPRALLAFKRSVFIWKYEEKIRKLNEWWCLCVCMRVFYDLISRYALCLLISLSDWSLVIPRIPCQGTVGDR